MVERSIPPTIGKKQIQSLPSLASPGRKASRRTRSELPTPRQSVSASQMG